MRAFLMSLLLLFSGSPSAAPSSAGGIPIAVSYNGYASVSGVDLSDHIKTMVLDLAQGTKEATQSGDSIRIYRSYVADLSADIEFYNDRAVGSVENTLRALVGSHGPVSLQAENAVTSASNPRYDFEGVIDGSLTVGNDPVGEVPMITVRFVSYAGTLTVTTTSS